MKNVQKPIASERQNTKQQRPPTKAQLKLIKNLALMTPMMKMQTVPLLPLVVLPKSYRKLQNW